MMRLRIPRTLATLALVLVAGACSSDRALAPEPRSAVTIASGPAPTKAQAKYEIDFLQSMIDHHMMAVMMAELCVEKAVHRELRSLCRDIIAAQSAEIEQMQGWLQEWYGITYEPRMTRTMQKEMDRLAALSGAEFEIVFMEMMVAHHEKAIREAERCVDRAYHPELEQLCEGIIATQSAEIEQMQQWLCEWYGRCAA
jgi:uncharacterized protein (DUF305 family)